MNHPARYSKKFLPIFADILSDCQTILDPMAGTGERLLELSLMMPNTKITGIELESEWANITPSIVRVGNVLELPFTDNCFDGILVSPPYGNRMADHHEAKDESVRNTYRHKLGRPLSDNNAGGMQWGDEYRNFHEKAWRECYRVTSYKFVINIKDHVRDKRRVYVTKWHIDTLTDIGFKFITMQNILCKGNRFGANSERVNHEHILTFIKE